MSFDTWKTTPPADEGHDDCSRCGKPATIDLTNAVHACSPECEAFLAEMWCAGGCGANLAEGDDCLCAEPASFVWEAAS